MRAALVLIAVALAACAADPCARSAPCRNDSQPTQAQRDGCRAQQRANAHAPCFPEAIAVFNCQLDNMTCDADGHSDLPVSEQHAAPACAGRRAAYALCCGRNASSPACIDAR
jgi:hypothetical protein